MTDRAPAGRARFTRPQWVLSVSLALAVIGFVAAAQWNSSAGRQEFITSAQRVLVIEAEQLQREHEQLLEDIEAAEAQVSAFQARGVGSDTQLSRLAERLRAARIAAGVVEMRGPGMVLEIADSQRLVPEGEPAQRYIVVADDLRDIVTALWASGAEAIAISDGRAEDAPAERLVATTAIYGGGAAIWVNGVPLSPPYRIEAIGPEGLRDRFLAHPAFVTRVAQRIEVFGLQFASEARDEVTVPRFVGNTQLRWGVSELELE